MRAAETRLACDMGLVNLRRESRRIRDALQGFPPRAFVRRSNENAVHVEDNSGKRAYGGGCCGHGKALVGPFRASSMSGQPGMAAGPSPVFTLSSGVAAAVISPSRDSMIGPATAP